MNSLDLPFKEVPIGAYFCAYADIIFDEDVPIPIILRKESEETLVEISPENIKWKEGRCNPYFLVSKYFNTLEEAVKELKL